MTEMMTLEEIDGWNEVLKSHMTGVCHESIDNLCNAARLAVTRMPEQDAIIEQQNYLLRLAEEHRTELEAEIDRLRNLTEDYKSGLVLERYQALMGDK